MSLESAFAQVMGRQASEEERGRLYKLRDALGVGDNDAVWLIVMALEQYDALFREYPRQLAAETSRSIELARSAFAAAAAKEAAEVQRALAEQVAQTSVQIARKLAERPVGVHRVTMLLAAAVAFGALCVNAGYSLAPGASRPFWVGARVAELSPVQRVLAAVLAVPSGWMIFALLVPLAAYGARTGWLLTRDGAADGTKAIGWSIVVLSAIGCIGVLGLIVRLT